MHGEKFRGVVDLSMNKHLGASGVQLPYKLEQFIVKELSVLRVGEALSNY